MNERPLQHARIELGGPLRSLEIAPATRISGELEPGERARFSLPCLVPAGEPLPREPRLVFTQDEPGQGSARFLGWEQDSAAWPANLALRPFPELASSGPLLAPASWMLLLAASLITLVPRKSLVSLALGGVAALGLFLWVQSTTSEPGALRVYEGAVGSSTWVQREIGVGELLLAAPTQGWRLDCEPASARIVLEASLRPADPLMVRAPAVRGAQLRGQRLLQDELGVFDPTAQAVFALKHAWRRSEQGWSYLGPWERGAPLPASRPGPPPPGWLVQGLPQGVEVFLGELADAPGSWVRVH